MGDSTEPKLTSRNYFTSEQPSLQTIVYKESGIKDRIYRWSTKIKPTNHTAKHLNQYTLVIVNRSFVSKNLAQPTLLLVLLLVSLKNGHSFLHLSLE